MNAKICFSDLADLAAQGIKPEGRGNATAGSLRQMGEIGGDLPLTLADLSAGFAQLAQAKSDSEPGNIASRRTTCGELAKLAGDATDGTAARLAAVFRAIEGRFTGSEDPRQAAMGATAGREAAELGG